MRLNASTWSKWILAVCAVLILAGLFFRLYRISDNQFLFYDEGMYLGYNRAFLNMVARNPPHNLSELGIIVSLMFQAALTTAKALWFFILNLRVFIWGPESWNVARWISAASGLGTVVLLYFWSLRYLQSRAVAALSALTLLILPSHVFYSRLGMQESLSTLMFLAAVYLYMTPKRLGWQVIVSGVLMACVYLTNYRMIIAPVYLVFIEAFEAYSQRKAPDWMKLGAACASYALAVLAVSTAYGGINAHVTMAWMLHQAKDAEGEIQLLNFLSYPYYTFALEGFFFGCCFWCNLGLIKSKDIHKLLPFGLAVLQMLSFSFAAEKGARYLCVVLPFVAAAAAVALEAFWQERRMRPYVLAVGGLAALGMVFISASLAAGGTDYGKAVHFITDKDPEAVIVATQPLVEGLDLSDERHMLACPHDLASLVRLYKSGARYLVIDPQAYISWTEDGQRFSPPLKDFLELPLQGAKPLAVFPHLNQLMLTRFVLDHNQRLGDSLAFLARARGEGFGQIRVYELGSVFAVLQQAHAQGRI